MRRSVTLLATVLAVMAISAETAFAAMKYKDVYEGYWALDAISFVSDMGLIVGDASGSFKPDAPIDKFEASKILAKAAGYKYTNASIEEMTYYSRAYAKNKSLLGKLAKSRERWNASADYEISFLLEKEILVVDDLNSFVVLDDDGDWQLQTLTRQEAARFLTRLTGKVEEAQEVPLAPQFYDDWAILAENKPYVYYLRSIGVIAGTADNMFMPNGAVVRASMAMMLSKCVDDKPVQQVAYSSKSASVAKITSVSGEILEIYPSFYGLMIDSGGTATACQVAASCAIYVEGFLKTYSDLRVGMEIEGVLLNSELVELKAKPKAPEPRQRIITGAVLRDVLHVDGTSLVLEAPDGSLVSAFFATGAIISRNGELAQPEALKPGDMLSVVLDGEKLARVDAAGVRASVEGVIVEIHITAEKHAIFLAQDGSEAREYRLDKQQGAVYSLRVGMRALLSLESFEVEDLVVLDGTVTGYIKSISKDELSMVNLSISNDSGVVEQVPIHVAAVCMDALTKKPISLAELSVGMRVSVAPASAGQPASYVAIIPGL
ncbi:MAG: S-layer homology domain-containing protein [Clostridiales bacterium]|jgi:hypothetical protein|nr:S-layer homology domain-containing protein [Clostridiales bacterium]